VLEKYYRPGFDLPVQANKTEKLRMGPETYMQLA
jgi:hypothetical protein